MLNEIAMRAASVAQKVLGGGVAVFKAELSNGMTGYGKISFIGTPHRISSPSYFETLYRLHK